MIRPKQSPRKTVHPPKPNLLLSLFGNGLRPGQRFEQADRSRARSRVDPPPASLSSSLAAMLRTILGNTNRHRIWDIVSAAFLVTTVANPMNERLHFESIKEHRGSYFVEYQPPIDDARFAILSLVFLAPISPAEAAKRQDKEAGHWLRRYPVPLMIWAMDAQEDTIVPPNCDSGCLVAWVARDSGKIVRSRNLQDLDVFLKGAPPESNWSTIYADVPVRTDTEIKAAARSSLQEQRRHIRSLKIVLILWLAVIPAGYAVFEYVGPKWLGLLGLAFVLSKAWKTGSQIWGRGKPSRREQEKAEKQRKMEHYFYHCERNPDGFLRLKSENFENDSRKQVRKEAEQIAADAKR